MARIRERRMSEEDRDDPRAQNARSGSASSDVYEESAQPSRDVREDDAVGDRELSDDERVALFKDSILQSVLPALPPMRGYHVCYLSTTNVRDTIQNRQRLGYQLITHEMIPRWKGGSLKSGEYPGVVSINEMVAARLPLSLYNRYMKESHHYAPLAEEEKIRANVEGLKQQGSRVLEEGDGTAEIIQRARPMPEFIE